MTNEPDGTDALDAAEAEASAVLKFPPPPPVAPPRPNPPPRPPPKDEERTPG